MTITRILTTTLALAAVGAAATTSIVDASPGALHASATIINLDGEVIGTARFVEDPNGRLHVNVKVEGLEAGEHGTHIHSAADCTTPFALALGHHNPLGVAHGGHAGDLPNLRANTAGRGQLNATTDHATLSAGPVSVFDTNGSAIIIHANPDNFVDVGSSGGRIACGVITPGS